MLWKCYRMLNINIKLAKQSPLSRSLSEHPTFISFLLTHSAHTRPDTYKHTHTFVVKTPRKQCSWTGFNPIRPQQWSDQLLLILHLCHQPSTHTHAQNEITQARIQRREFLMHPLSSMHPLSFIKKLKCCKYKMPHKWNPCGKFYSTR